VESFVVGSTGGGLPPVIAGVSPLPAPDASASEFIMGRIVYICRPRIRSTSRILLVLTIGSDVGGVRIFGRAVVGLADS